MKKEKLKKIVKYLEKDVKLFSSNIKLYKVLTLIISILIIVGLNSMNIISFRSTKPAKKVETKFETLNDDYEDAYMMASEIEMNYQIKGMYETYKLDLNVPIEDVETKSEGAKNEFEKYMDILKNTMKNSLPNDATDIMDNSVSMVSGLEKVKTIIKPSENTKYVKELTDELVKIDSENSKLAHDFEFGYLVQKYPKKEQLLKPLIEKLSKYNYIIYSKNFTIGTIKSEGYKIKINLLDLNTMKYNEKGTTITVNELFEKIPRGFPNVAVIFKDGTIEITDMIPTLLGVDPLSPEILPYSNVRIIESNILDINKVENNLKLYNGM